jgi:hypothetical protein
MQAVANWKQIQGRIRKARTSSDPAGELAQLFEKFRDAMVAFELAKLLEKSGQNDEAARWYATAAEHFRRAEWKKKANEALARLGQTRPEPAVIDIAAEASPREEAAPPPEQQVLPLELAPEAEATTAEEEETPTETPRGKRRRRGRRGGRGRRRGQAKQEPTPPPAPPIEPAAPQWQPVAAPAPPPEPEPVSSAPAPQVRGRAGEPAMASRMAQLEMQLRRLIAGPQYGLDELEHAPVGPGVLLLSDSDQVTHYYVEACRTIRIALANVKGSDKGRRSEGSVRKRLAEHLGISETRVAKYLKEHCVVRWLQLDEGASHLAHFAIAILQPVLNQ